jgi:dTDP-4-amino-4,6-dideoxygalactose transaminase
LDPLPDGYRRRYTNVQAAIGLEGLHHLDEWTARTRAHALALDRALGALFGVTTPVVPSDRTHVYYQYCAYVPDRDALARACLARGVDVETLHVDVCTRLDLFGRPRPAPGADRAAQAVQLPAYESLTDEQVMRVARVVEESLAPRGSPARARVPQSHS